MFGSRAARGARRRGMLRDERGSMPVAVLVTLVAMSLSSGLAGLVAGQLRNSRAEADRVAALSAAQAGLDAGAAQIRLAATRRNGNDPTALPSSLPCAATKSALPTVAGTAAAVSTSYAYFLVNPDAVVGTVLPLGDLGNISDLITGKSLTDVLSGAGKTLADVDDQNALSAAVNTALPCNPKLSNSLTPLYALMRSQATVGGATRTLYASYQLRSKDETLDGGRLVIQQTGGKQCIGAQSGEFTSSWNGPRYVYSVPCTTKESELVTFIYPKNLSLSLTKTRTNPLAPNPFTYGLCITTTALPKDKDPVTFEPCKAPSTREPTQMFSYDVNAQTWYAPFTYNSTTGVTALNTTATASAGGTFCLNVFNGRIVLRVTSTYCGTANRADATFVAEPTVGAGGAGVGSQQFVNFAEVGRCLDLTNENPNKATNAALALITYPCKQSFSGTPYWNHRWFSPAIATGAESASGPIYTVPTTGSYLNQKWCVKSPGLAGGYVWVALCAAADPEQVWTVYGAAASAAKAYQVSDMYGNCLMAGASLGFKYGNWSYVITAPCDGKDPQKWNAPRSFKVSPISGIQER